MLELLSPRRVAARKLARQIAQRRPSAAGKKADLESRSGIKPGKLEYLLDEELRKYGIYLVQ